MELPGLRRVAVLCKRAGVGGCAFIKVTTAVAHYVHLNGLENSLSVNTRLNGFKKMQMQQNFNFD